MCQVNGLTDTSARLELLQLYEFFKYFILLLLNTMMTALK